MINTIVILTGLGVVSAVLLWLVAKRFRVEEDPRIDEVLKMLPGANCGGCGFAGCAALAEQLVVREDIAPLYCPVGGGDTMTAVASMLGKEAPVKEKEVAEVRCGGCYARRARVNKWDGASSCAAVAALYAGETGCAQGCLGEGDCARACVFGAITMGADGLPMVDENKCTACGTCVGACPKALIELRKQGVKNRRVFVACRNTDKGGVARKACEAACIGCGKCAKACEFGAITVENNLAFIDSYKCKLCRKCVTECPTGAIKEANYV